MAHLHNYSYTEHSPLVICSTHVLALYTDTIHTQYIYIHVYWYMEAVTCGVRGAMKVAHIDMRNTSIDGPAPLTQYQLDSGERVMRLLI